MQATQLVAILGLWVAGWLPDPAPAGVARADAERRSNHEDPAVASALAMVGQPLNPVVVIGPAEIRSVYARVGAGAPPRGLDAFRSPADPRDPAIYVSRESTIYRSAARTGSAVDLLKLAATLVHEQVHNTDREFAACRFQADFVRSRLPHLGQADRAAPSVTWSPSRHGRSPSPGRSAGRTSGGC